jgi:hypothetical protein
MQRTINDWETVVRSLIKHMREEGYKTVWASNGEDSIRSEHTGRLASKVCECDEGHLKMTIDDVMFTLYIVLGNSPCETVSDYSWGAGTPEVEIDQFSNHLTKWSESWELRGNACPKKVVELKY